MLNDKSPIAETREIGLVQKSITISFNDDPSTVRLKLPSAADLRQLPETNIEWSTNTLLELGEIEETEFYKNQLVQYESKFDEYKSNLPFLVKYAHLNDLAGFSEKAEDQLTSMLDQFDNDIVKNELASLLLSKGDFDQASDLYKNSDLNSNIEANLRLAQLSIQKRDLTTAKEYVARAVNIDVADYRARMFEGTILLAEKKWSSAIRSYRVASESNSKSAVLFLNMGVAYWYLNQDKKAIRSLKKAVHLDPTSANSCIFLADVLLYSSRPQECIQFLTKLSEYEPRNSSVWARLGKAFYDSSRLSGGGKKYLKKALESFVTQSRLSENGYSWNSIGAVYGQLGEVEKAKRYFSKSLTDQNSDSKISELSLANLLTSMVELKEYKEALQISKAFLDDLEEKTVLTKHVSRIYLNFIICLEALDKRSEAYVVSEKLLELEILDLSVKMDLMSHVFYHMTVVQPDSRIVEKYVPEAIELIRQSEGVANSVLCRISNNVVFALLMFDRMVEAKDCLYLLGKFVHVDAYATATLGLYHLKNGRYDQSKILYEDALSLLTSKVAKERMKQRMFFEFGKQASFDGNTVAAEQYLAKAAKRKNGFNYVGKDIHAFISRIKN